MFPRNVLYFGKEAPLPERLPLRAGPLSLIYEGGDLRAIRLGEREVLRRVYAAVRDRNWGTVLPIFSNQQIDLQNDSFRIEYDVDNQQGEIDFAWHGSLTGDAEGRLTVTLDGVARSTFWKNRIGICVLHSASSAGAACRVEHSDGTAERAQLPVWPVPDQPVAPFADMRALAHEVLPGVWAKLRFSGERFEMEDQRLWTDASFKTYGTPLGLPFPVEVHAGTPIAQMFHLTLADERPAAGEALLSAREAPLSFSVAWDAPARPLPRIGLGVASHGQPLSEREMARLKDLRLSHLRVDLPLSEADIADRLGRAAAEASALGIPLEAALLVSEDGERELGQFRAVVEQARPRIARWLVYAAHEHYAGGTPFADAVRLARRHLGDYDPGAGWVTGSNTDLIWLLRTPAPLALIDGVTFAITPQAHAFDNASLVENLEGQAVAVLSAQQYAAGRPVLVSPVTLKMRHNPYATGAVPPTPVGTLPAPVDVRQMSLLGAGWTAGSLKYLAESGASSVTFYETSGWRGVMERESGSPLPEIFRSLPGSVFPLYHVLADIGEFAGGEIASSQSSDPLRVNGLVMRQANRLCAIVANLSGETCRVAVPDIPAGVRARVLDETNVLTAMQVPEAYRAQNGATVSMVTGTAGLDLRPYAVVRLDMTLHAGAE